MATQLSDDCRQFYLLRNQRTVEYTNREVRDLQPVHVVAGFNCTATQAGQLALLALANQLARVSRRIVFEMSGSDVEVLVTTPFGNGPLGDVLLRTVRAIDPCGEFAIGLPSSQAHIGIGLGDDVKQGLDWYIGADRSVARLRHEPISVSDQPGTLRGAALASSLGAAAVFRSQLGLRTTERTLSAWNYAEGASASYGPESLEPVDIGRVLMVGAGAVGAAAAYWLRAFGVNGDGWAVVDGDVVELHNTNRGLVFTARDAGWPNGMKAKKAELIASVIRGATEHKSWYHESSELRNRRFDVVLALANDHEVRAALTHLNSAISFQATTGENWLSQLHRHILGRDGCIWCRTGKLEKASFQCSDAPVESSDGTRSDAALPFLSAASGLLLVTALQRLAAGDIGDDPANCWSWDFSSEYRMASTPTKRECADGCAFRVSETVRRKLVAGTRWAPLLDAS